MPSAQSQLAAVDLINKINQQIFNPIIKIIFVAGIVLFMWGVVEFIMGMESDDKRTTGKQHMLWGIIGVFIMASVFGLLHLIAAILTDLTS